MGCASSIGSDRSEKKKIDNSFKKEKASLENSFKNNIKSQPVVRNDPAPKESKTPDVVQPMEKKERLPTPNEQKERLPQANFVIEEMTSTENVPDDEYRREREEKSIKENPSETVKIESNDHKVVLRNENTQDNQNNIPLISEEKIVETVINKINTILKQNGVSEDTVLISVTNTLTANKDDYDNFEISEQKTFSFLKNKKNVKWNKKPFSFVVNDINKFFDDNKLYDYYGFDWTHFAKENEKRELKLKLKKSIAGSEKFEEEEIKLEDSERPKLILIFNESDAFALQKIKEISKFRDIFSNFDFIPIIGCQIKKKDDAIEKLRFLEMVGIMNTDIYFFKKKGDDDDDLEKIMSFKSGDVKDEVISTALVVGGEGVIRYIGSPKDLYIENLRSYFDPEYFKEDDYIASAQHIKSNLFADLNVVSSGCVKLIKSEIYDSELQLVNIFYEPPKVEIRHNAEIFSKLMSTLKISVNDNKTYVVKLDEKQRSLASQIASIYQNLEQQEFKFSAGFHVIKRFNGALPNFLQNLRMSIDKKRVTSLNFKCSSESFEQLNAPLMNQMALVRTNPLLENVSYMCLTPEIGSRFAETVKVIDSEDNSEIELNLNSNQAKLIIVLSSIKNEEEKADVTGRLNRIWNNLIGKEDLLSKIQIALIYYGESAQEARELIDNSFGECKIHLVNQNVYSNFPFNYDNEGPKLLFIINDNENIVKYVGNATDVLLADTMEQLANGDSEIKYKPNYPMSYENYKSSFKVDLSNLIDALKELFSQSEYSYKPIIEFSFLKETEFIGTQPQETVCKNLKLKILMKKVSDNLISDENIKQLLKDIQKNYGISLKIMKIPCVGLEVQSYNCSTCGDEVTPDNNNILEYYYDQEKSMVYCVNCEKILENNPTNLIYLKYNCEKKLIMSELIQGYFEMNINSNTHIENIESPSCSVCGVDFSGHNIAWMSQIHLNHLSPYDEEITHPVLICDRKCFPQIKDKTVIKTSSSLLYDVTLTQQEKRRIKLCGIDRSSLVFKKIVLPMN